jgi:hypothetical protein
MAQTWQVIRGGTTYTVSGGTYSYLVAAMGIGAPPKRNISVRGPQQHGHTITDFRYDARQIRLVYHFDKASLALADTNRDSIYNIWKGIEGEPVKLRVTRDDERVYTIDCECTGVIDMDNDLQNRIGTSQRFVVTLEAGDPFWYNHEASAESFQASGSGLLIPLAIPLVMTGVVITESRAIVYNGSWRSYPIVTIVGSIESPVIANLTTGEKLDFTGVTIADGDSRIIDLRYGYKTVKDASGANKLADLTTDSNLATWHLAPSGEALDGINSIQITGSGGNANTRAILQWNERYIGI